MNHIKIFRDGPKTMQCLTCTSPTGDSATLCKLCASDLRRDLRDLGPALADLRITAARLDKGAPSLGHASGSNPLPVNFDATDVGRDTERKLRRWAKSVHASEATSTPLADPRNARQLPQWLIDHLGTIRHLSDADKLVRDIRAALLKCRRTVDRAEQRVFAGICPTETGTGECGAILMAKQGSAMVTCRSCGIEFDVSMWRKAALSWSLDQSAYPETISRALSDPVTGECIPAETIRLWASRGLIRAVNEEYAAVADHPVRRMYLIRDVHDVWVEHLRGAYIKKPSGLARQETILTV